MCGKKLFLPDFCQIGAVFALVLSGQLLAFVLALAAPSEAGFWQDLSLLSLLIQWIVLTCAALLCAVRRWLGRLSNVAAALLSYLLVLLVTAVISECAYRLLHDFSLVEIDHAFVLRALGISAIVAALALRYLYVAHQWWQRLESETNARVEALQARIRPHFLFNSLNTIAAMIPVAPDKAEAAVEDLADLLRASLARSGQLVTFAEELALAKGYVRMESLRLDQRLLVRWEVAAVPGDVLLPPLTLQPLLENAVYYGVEPRQEPSEIRVEGRCERGRLVLSVTNPLPPESHAQRPGLGIAQDNIRQRLVLAFGSAASLTTSTDGGEYRVELRLPCRQVASAVP